MTKARLLIFGYGNPGRGDDALGPELVARLKAEHMDGIECQDDMQLQVEHVTDLQDREAIIFIDADASCESPFRFSAIAARKDDSYTSHAMTPHALLHAYRTVYGEDAPPAFLLRVRGYSFELGEPLSETAAANLMAVLAFIRESCVKSDALRLSGIANS